MFHRASFQAIFGLMVDMHVSHFSGPSIMFSAALKRISQRLWLTWSVPCLHRHNCLSRFLGLVYPAWFVHEQRNWVCSQIYHLDHAAANTLSHWNLQWWCSNMLQTMRRRNWTFDHLTLFWDVAGLTFIRPRAVPVLSIFIGLFSWIACLASAMNLKSSRTSG